MSELIQSYQYQKQIDEVIEVLFDNQGYLNATKVAKAFGKKVYHYLETDKAKEYIRALSKKLNIPTGLDSSNTVHGKTGTEKKQLIIIVQGAPQLREQGTWLHPKLAIEFARWLSPEFAIWCDEQIEMILKGHQILSLESLSNLLDQKLDHKITLLEQNMLLEIQKMKDSLLVEIDRKLEERLEEKLEQKQKHLIFEYLSTLYEQGAITQNQLLKLKEKLNLFLSPASSNLVGLDCPSQEQLKLEAQLLKENGYSWQNIAAKFNERNIPTLSGRGCWTASNIQYLLT